MQAAAGSNSFPLIELPDLVILEVAKHLTSNDGRNLKMTCQRFKNILPTYPKPEVIHVADLNEHQEWQDSHFSPKEYFRCHNLNHHVEKIDVSLKWKDQGWGNRKGQVWLKLHRPVPSTQEEDELIFQMEPETFGIAPHSLAESVNTLTETDDIVKLAKPGDYYQIMKNIGGGGNHILIVEDFKMTIHYKPYFARTKN